MSSKSLDDHIFYNIVGGMDNKGHVYGLSHEAAKFKTNSTTSLGGDSHFEYEQMRNLIFSLSTKN